MRVEPRGDAIDAGDRRGTGPAGKLGIARELRLPPAHLPLQIIVGLAETVQPGRAIVDRAQSGDRLDHRQADTVAHCGVAGVERGQPLRRIEALDRLHQVEGGAQHILFRAGRHQPRVRHRGAVQRREHARLAAHRVVRIGARRQRRAAEDIGRIAAPKAQQDVLRAAGEQLCICDSACAHASAIHPALQRGGVDSLDHPDSFYYPVG